MPTTIGNIEMLKHVSMSMMVHIARLCPDFLLAACCWESELVVVFDEPSVCTTIFSSMCKRRIVITHNISHTTIHSMTGTIYSSNTICWVLDEVTAIYEHAMYAPSGISTSSNVAENAATVTTPTVTLTTTKHNVKRDCRTAARFRKFLAMAYLKAHIHVILLTDIN